MFMNWAAVFHAKQFEFYDEKENISLLVAFFNLGRIAKVNVDSFFPGFSKIRSLAQHR